jgi:PEP-CTERM putative exosortase interaction domain
MTHLQIRCPVVPAMALLAALSAGVGHGEAIPLDGTDSVLPTQGSLATVPTLIFDAATGGMSLDPAGVQINFFSILSESEMFNGQAAMPSGGIGFQVNQANEFGDANFTGNFFENEIWDFGVVAPAGLSEEFIRGDISGTYTRSQAQGAGGGSFELSVVNAVPEPGTGSLIGLAIAGLAVAGVRRRVAGVAGR